MKNQPESAPLPKPAPEGVGPNATEYGLRHRFQSQLAENWRNSDPRFWPWLPNFRYRFRAAELRAMADLMTEEEVDDLLGAYQISRSKMKAANSLKLPYALADRLIKEDCQMEFPGEPESLDRSSIAQVIRKRVLYGLHRRSMPGQIEKLSVMDIRAFYNLATHIVRDEIALASEDSSETEYIGALDMSPD